MSDGFVSPNIKTISLFLPVNAYDAKIEMCGTYFILFTSLYTIEMKACYVFTQMYVYILTQIDRTPYYTYNDIFLLFFNYKE